MKCSHHGSGRETGKDRKRDSRKREGYRWGIKGGGREGFGKAGEQGEGRKREGKGEEPERVLRGIQGIYNINIIIRVFGRRRRPCHAR